MDYLLFRLYRILRPKYPKIKSSRNNEHLIAIIMIFGGLVLALIAIKYLPEYQIQVDIKKGIIRIEEASKQLNEYRKLIVQLIGGIAILIGVYFAWRRVRATEESQITDRFTRAIEHLGNEKIAIRIGGIYALERIAKDSKNDYWTVIEVLMSFIRNDEISNGSIDVNEKRDSSADVKAAVSVIQRRDSRYDKGKIILDGSNLKNCDFSRTNLEQSSFKNTNLEGAIFGASNLKYAVFDNANLKGVNFRFANLEDAKFNNSDLENAHFENSNLIFSLFTRSNMKFSKFDFALADAISFLESDLEGVSFLGAYLGRSRFFKTNLDKCNFDKSNIKDSHFKEVPGLTESQIKDAKINKATKFE